MVKQRQRKAVKSVKRHQSMTATAKIRSLQHQSGFSSFGCELKMVSNGTMALVSRRVT